MAAKLRRLLRTTAFRTASAYACAFSLLAAAGMGFVYWSTKSHIEGQVDERLRLETNVLLKLYRNQALPALMNTIQQRSNSNQPSIFFYLLLHGPNQGILAGRAPDWMTGVDIQRSYATLRLSDVFQVETPDNDDRIRVLVTSLPDGYQLLVGRDLNEERALLEHTLTMILLVTGAMFLLAISGTVIMGRHTLHRIDAISETAGAIIAGDLSQRLPLSSNDNEFDQLSRKLNAMLARIEQLMLGMRQVTDNVAHDLRRPLNRLRNRLEVTLLEARSDEEYRQVMEQGIADADELLKTFNALLSIAQAEAGVRRNDWSRVDLSAVAEDLADLYGAVAEDKGIVFEWHREDAVEVPGNRHLLAQAIGNLLDNAIKYTPSDGAIEFKVERLQGVATITVADTGPGIPESARERVLKRFERLDNARSSPGSGLGLSLVKAVAQLHGAQLQLAANNDGDHPRQNPGLRASLRFVELEETL